MGDAAPHPPQPPAEVSGEGSHDAGVNGERLNGWLRPAKRLSRLPRWVLLMSGAGCLLLGLVLLGRPLRTLQLLPAALGVGAVCASVCAVAGLRRADAPWNRVVRAVIVLGGLLAAGFVTLAPAEVLRLLALAVPLVLLVVGSLQLRAAFQPSRGVGAAGASTGTRLCRLLVGCASLMLAMPLWSWPDLALLAVSLLVASALLVAGGWLLLLAVVGRRRTGAIAPALRRRRAGRDALRLAGASLALLLALSLLTLLIGLERATPVPDAFYTAPATLPATPGVLLRSAPFTRDLPPGAHVWRILYTTTLDDDTPAVASALVVAPSARVANVAMPVVAWAHGTTGVAVGCAPSLSRRPFTNGALPPLETVLSQGWVLVATDYVGLGTAGQHPYLVGAAEGRSVLDAVRAARQLPDLTLAEQTVVWGHSQGGHAALWTGIIAPTYAPEIELQWIVASAPATDLVALLRREGVSPQRTSRTVMTAFTVAAYSARYPDISARDLVLPAAQLFAREAAERCLTEPALLLSVVSARAFRGEVLAVDPGVGAFGAHLRANTPTQPIAAPVLLAQAADDATIVASVQDAFVAGRCAAGQVIDYRTYLGRGHRTLMDADSPLIPDLLAWTQARFGGEPAFTSCQTSIH